LDCKFKWNYHINNLTNIIRKFFYVFHDLRHIFNTDMKRTIYLALVQYILCYGIVFWGQAYESHIHSLNITLNNVIQFIFNLPRLTNNELVYNIFYLLNIRCLYYKNLLLTYYNFKNNTVHIDHICITRYKTNINLYVPLYHKSINSLALKVLFQLQSEYYQLCRILKINICNFKNVKDLKMYLKNVDLTQIDL